MSNRDDSWLEIIMDSKALLLMFDGYHKEQKVYYSFNLIVLNKSFSFYKLLILMQCIWL